MRQPTVSIRKLPNIGKKNPPMPDPHMAMPSAVPRLATNQFSMRTVEATTNTRAPATPRTTPAAYHCQSSFIRPIAASVAASTRKHVVRNTRKSHFGRYFATSGYVAVVAMK